MLRIAATALLALLFGAAPPPSRTPTVSIVAFYRERMMLPEGGTLRVMLVDANTRRTLASATLDNPHVPVHMLLSYEPSNIEASHVYTVDARILVHGEPFFAMEMPAKVITQNNPSHVELLLVRVTPTSPAMLEERRWTVWELGGHIITAENRPFLKLSAGLSSGSGGCNRFSGSYKLHSDSLEFGTAAVTAMACIHQSVMENETVFFKTLSSVRYWKVDGSDLQLLDGGRKTLMRLTADTD